MNDIIKYVIYVIFRTLWKEFLIGNNGVLLPFPRLARYLGM